MKVLRVFLTFLFSFVFFSNAHATLAWPGAERFEDVTEKFGLAATDRITIRMYFPQNYFLRIHEGFEYTSEITDKDDLARILVGFSAIGVCSNYDSRYESLGDWTFYSGGKEIFKIGLSFHYLDPIFVLQDDCYLSYATELPAKGQFINTVLKYMPADLRKARSHRPAH